MSSTNIAFTLGPSSVGVPLTTQVEQNLSSAAMGGSYTADYFANQWKLAQFTTWLNAQGQGAWTEGTDGNGNPTYTAEDSGSQMQMVLSTTPATAVISGEQPPQQFTWNGQSYNIAGTLTGTFSYNQQPLWIVQVPLGVAEMGPITVLASYAWAGLVQPLLGGFCSGVVACFSGAAATTTLEGAAAVASTAAEEAAVGAIVVEGATVSLAVGVAALTGLAVLIAIPIVLDLILHSSFHNLKVYNLTPYDLTWSLAYVYEGQMTMAPVVGQGSTDFDFVVPAMGTVTPPGLQPVAMAYQADFSFTSGSVVHGLGYVMSFEFTDPNDGNASVGASLVMIDVPWAGSNSLAVTLRQSGDAASFYHDTMAGTS